MSRNPYRRILVVAALLALFTVPMVNARTVEPPSVTRVQAGDWFEATLRWVEEFAGMRRPAHRRGPQTPPNTKSENSTNAAGCLDPAGKPWCYV